METPHAILIGFTMLTAAYVWQSELRRDMELCHNMRSVLGAEHLIRFKHGQSAKHRGVYEETYGRSLEECRGW